MAAKRILMLVGDFVEDYEAMVPFQALHMVGHTVHAVCPGKKAGEKIRTAVHDFEGDQTYSEKRGHDFAVNATFDTIQATDYDGLVIAGGRAPEYLRLERKVIDLVRHFTDAKKPIAAICHGPWTLIDAGGVKGKTMTSWPSLKTDLTNAGAHWVDKSVVTDKGLVTSRKPDDLADFCRKMVEEFAEGRHLRAAS